MQIEKRIYIGLGVLAVLGALIYVQWNSSKKSIAAHSVSAASASFPSIKLPEEELKDMTKLVLKSKQEVVLEKREDKWWLTKPVEAIANQDNVKSLLDSLKEIEVKDAINATPEAAQQHKDYELDDEKAVHVQAFKGDKAAFDMFFGKSSSRVNGGHVARLPGNPAIWVVKGYASFQFTREPKDWRDKAILKFEEANAVAVTIKNENGEYSFSKNDDKWNATFKGGKIDRFDDAKVKDMLRAYQSLNAEDFADDKKDKGEETGLVKPAAVVTITLKDNAGKHVLNFGKTSTGSSRYALKEGNATPYVVGSWAADWAVAKVEKFQKAEDKKGDKSDPGMPPGMPGMPPGMPAGMPPMPEE